MLNSSFENTTVTTVGNDENALVSSEISRNFIVHDITFRTPDMDEDDIFDEIGLTPLCGCATRDTDKLPGIKTVLSDNTKPALFITGTVYRELRYLAEKHPSSEWAVFLLLKKVSSQIGHWIAYDFVMPGQIVQSAHVSIDGNEASKFYDKIVAANPYYKEQLHKKLAHLHSHGGFATEWSGTDTHQQTSRDDLGWYDESRFYIVINARGDIRANHVQYRDYLATKENIPVLIYSGKDGYNDILTVKREKVLDEIWDHNVVPETKTRPAYFSPITQKMPMSRDFDPSHAYDDPWWKDYDEPAITEKERKVDPGLNNLLLGLPTDKDVKDVFTFEKVEWAAKMFPLQKQLDLIKSIILHKKGDVELASRIAFFKILTVVLQDDDYFVDPNSFNFEEEEISAMLRVLSMYEIVGQTKKTVIPFGSLLCSFGSESKTIEELAMDVLDLVAYSTNEKDKYRLESKQAILNDYVNELNQEEYSDLLIITSFGNILAQPENTRRSALGKWLYDICNNLVSFSITI